MTNNWDVIVVGGGLAGLAAGATATRAGASTLVLEGHQAGGRARVSHKDGFAFNMGAHALYVKGPGWEVLHQLGVVPVGTPPPLQQYQLWYQGQAHLLPTNTSSMLKTTALSARSKTQLARLLGALPLMKPARYADVSVEDWLASRQLRPDAEAALRALIRIGSYSSDFQSLSAEAVVGQLQSGARHGVLYLHGGWSQLIDGLAARTQLRTGTTVRRLEPAGDHVAVETDDATLTARHVVLAAGSPAAARALLPADPGWGDLGQPVTAACLDVATTRPPTPGYMLGADDPVYATTQSPPGRQAPEGHAVVSVLRYGARAAEQDRADMEAYLDYAGVRPEDVVFDRFLARMVVTGAQPLARLGGFAGRPSIDATGTPGISLAGDWVGPAGLLADAALASGHAAGLAAARQAGSRASMVA